MITVLRNEGNFVFTPTQDAGGCGDFPRQYLSIARGRFQGTGESDLAATEECRAFVNVILGDGLGVFSHNCSTDRYQVHPDSAAYIDGVAAGHLNGGTKTDMVVAVRDTHEVSILLGRGNGTFQRPAPGDSGYLFSVQDPLQPLVSMSPVQVIVADLDQNGFGDIVTTCEGDRDYGFRYPALSVLINNGFVSFPPP